MALKINLKAGERLLIATSRLTVASEGYTTIIIEGDLPVMRESESITLEQAQTPRARIYYHMQQFYLSQSAEHMKIVQAISETLSDDERAEVQHVLNHVEAGSIFTALKAARKFAEF